MRFSPSSHTGSRPSRWRGEKVKLSTLLVLKKRMEKVKGGKTENGEAITEVIMRERMQWWGFLELLDFNPKPGGGKMDSDNLKPNSANNKPKSKTTFKKGRKAMKTGIFFLVVLFAAVCIFSFSSAQGTPSGQPYACEEDLIEVMFAQDSKVRLRGDALVDLKTDALAGMDEVLAKAVSVEWYRICDVPEERVDEIQSRGEANTGKPVYNLNNIYRLRITKGVDVWTISKELEALPGVILARPVPKPMPLPTPPDYEWMQGYLDPASSTPTGIDANYAWTQPGGDGSGVTVCDLEYSWNYNHADITKAFGSQINSNVSDPFSDNNHGTAVIGVLVSDPNTPTRWGTTGICYGSQLLTCGTYYGSPAPSWNVPGAMAVAIANLSAGDVMLLEQQWDYTSASGFIPIEWWLNYSPSPQTFNGVYAAIVTSVSYASQVVQAGGNGYYNNDLLPWYGNSGAIIVGAGGAYSGGTWPNGDLQKLSFSSYGSRFDLQGWGEDVVTTGYSNLYSAEGINRWYTNTFSGTSSASPIVAGAVACCVGYWKVNIGGALPSPGYLRTTLINTGTPQIVPPAGHIGPRPDLAAAFLALSGGASTRGDANGDGVVDLGDILFLINYLYKGGPAPNPLWTGDANSDGTVDLGDVLYLINYLYKGGPSPCSRKAGEVLSNTFKLSRRLGHAEISLVLKSDPADEILTGFAKASPEGFDEVSEISIVGEFDRDVAGVHLEIEFNPDEITLLDPVLTPLTRSLQLFSGTKDGIQKIGIVDLSGKEFLPAGEGTLVNLRAKGKDLTSIKIKKAILLDMDAVPLDLELSSELRLKESKNFKSGPQHFSLSQNYPNPFNPQTSIRYALPQDAYVRLIIYNILGEKVGTLVNEQQSAGHNTVCWDGKDEKGDQVASGVYFYRLEADKFSEVKKMLLVK